MERSTYLKMTEPGTTEYSRGLSPKLLLIGIIPVHFLCFYWWSAQIHYFTGDDLYYFSRQIHSLSDFTSRFLSVDEMYQYRPLTYVLHTFVLVPMFGNSAPPYHIAAYLFSTINALLACACLYYWTGKSLERSLFGSIFLVLNPIHFFPSFGSIYIDQWLSSFFYFVTLLILLRPCAYASILAPLTFLLALLSKEHSVTLPSHAVMIFLALNVPLREALRKTRTLWIVLAIFMAFQLFIRQGSLFAPAGANENMKFAFSAARIVELARGVKPAIYYPENYSMDKTIGFGRMLRLATLVPILSLMFLGLKRRPTLALSGLAWFAVSLLPIAFIQMAPFPRHYYLGLPGLAVVFACAIPSWRVMAMVTPLLAFVTVTNIRLYARESWIAVGALRTKAYIGHIEEILGRTGRPLFYVMNGGDPKFFWHIDRGAALPEILKRNVSFRFAGLSEPIDTDEWLHNNVNMILAHNGEITDGMNGDRFPPLADERISAYVRDITGADGQAALLFRGMPVIESDSRVVETPNGLPIFRTPAGIVTISRLTIRIRAESGLHLDRTVRVVPESRDGVVIQLHTQRGSTFSKVYSQPVGPGERRQLKYRIDAGQADYVLIRIHPGARRDEQSDWLVWES